MDMSPAGPGLSPWLVAVVVLAVLALAAAAVLLVLRRRRGRRPGAGSDASWAPPGVGDDDLPGFLEFPPGVPGGSARPAGPVAGWPALAADPAPPGHPPGPPSGAERRGLLVLGGAAVAVLLGVVVLAGTHGDGRGRPGPDRTGDSPDRGAVDLPSPPTAPVPGAPGAGELADVTVRPGRDGGAARLSFGGLVLEQRAVGITATYPEVAVTWNGEDGVAHVRLPTFNCLTPTAPADPVAAGCVATIPEYADLPTPQLDVRGDDGSLRLSGQFPTYVRSNGSPPAWTGRVYELQVRAMPLAGKPGTGWVPAEGEIVLGPDRAPTLAGPDVTVLRRD